MPIFRYNHPTEVLAPCGEEESLDAALRFGADAVYLAGKEFGMRTASKNFDNDQLISAVKRPMQSVQGCMLPATQYQTTRK